MNILPTKYIMKLNILKTLHFIGCDLFSCCIQALVHQSIQINRDGFTGLGVPWLPISLSHARLIYSNKCHLNQVKSAKALVSVRGIESHVKGLLIKALASKELLHDIVRGCKMCVCVCPIQLIRAVSPHRHGDWSIMYVAVWAGMLLTLWRHDTLGTGPRQTSEPWTQL